MQLEVEAAKSKPVLFYCFNSILVQLEAITSLLVEEGERSFNSILVQLEGVPSLKLSYVLTRFQFHIGAIRSRKLNFR